MATQAALIVDTIVGMKRALCRERDDSGPDDPITQPTNRGNKMRANAKYVREGAMGYINAENFYREKIDHAGYTRHILQRNPIRYDSEGDELDEEDEDSEADADVAEENPFSGITLETLLCPLKHPSELPGHPSLSHAYTSQALEQMTAAVEKKLREERVLLWQARNLHGQFLGDVGWMPCGIFETPDDRWIFEPRIVDDNQSVSMDQQRVSGLGTPASGGVNAAQELPAATASAKETQLPPDGTAKESQAVDNDVEMAEIPSVSVETQQAGFHEETAQFKSEEKDGTVTDLPQHPTTADNTTDTNGEGLAAGENEFATSGDKPEGANALKDGGKPDTGANEDETEQNAEMHDGSSPEPPRRMTTRAQANAANPQSDGESPTSPADSATSLPTPHPLFLIPDSVRPDANFGLPAAEAEETRRLLWSYIQKQEETVRGFEHMLESLLRACRMKSDVLEWCKAEGHVGEMSDGEDWYDREKLGLAEGEDLKKGTDEDEVEVVDESRTTAKRGRGRRA